MKKYKRIKYTKNKNRQLLPKKVRIFPNSNQIHYINLSCGNCRFVYNYLLNYINCEHKRLVNNINTAYENYIYYNEIIPDDLDLKKEYVSLSPSELNRIINNLKETEGYEWLKLTNSKVIQQVIRDLITAFDRFFKHISDYPQLKKKGRDKDSCRFIEQAIIGGSSKQGILCIKGNRLTINKNISGVLYKCSRRDEKYLNKYLGLIHNINLSKTKTNEYYASISIENILPNKVKKTGAAVGLDLGIKYFCISSDGIKYENMHWLKKSMKLIKRVLRQLSRRKGECNHEKTRLKLAKLFRNVTNKRTAHHHNLSKQLICDYDVICIEDLNISGMIKNHKLSLSILDVSWSEFIQLLTYKCLLYGKLLVKVDRWYASSKLCNKCGYKNKNLTLNDRSWLCPICGEYVDRDINAANNILNEGLKILFA